MTRWWNSLGALLFGRRSDPETVEIVEGRPGSGVAALGNPHEMCEIVHAEVEKARQVGDPDRLRFVLETEVSLRLDLMGDAAGARPSLDELESMARAGGPPELLIRCLGWRSRLFCDRGDLTGARELCLQRLALARESGDGETIAGAQEDLETVETDLTAQLPGEVPWTGRLGI